MKEKTRKVRKENTGKERKNGGQHLLIKVRKTIGKKESFGDRGEKKNASIRNDFEGPVRRRIKGRKKA